MSFPIGATGDVATLRAFRHELPQDVSRRPVRPRRRLPFRR